jgi:hypothetical protein
MPSEFRKGLPDEEGESVVPVPRKSAGKRKRKNASLTVPSRFRMFGSSSAHIPLPGGIKLPTERQHNR